MPDDGDGFIRQFQEWVVGLAGKGAPWPTPITPSQLLAWVAFVTNTFPHGTCVGLYRRLNLATPMPMLIQPDELYQPCGTIAKHEELRFTKCALRGVVQHALNFLDGEGVVDARVVACRKLLKEDPAWGRFLWSFHLDEWVFVPPAGTVRKLSRSQKHALGRLGVDRRVN